MAKLKIFAVWDNAVGAYGTVHAEITKGVAIRNFSDAVDNGKSALANHPSDFSLHCLGELDTESGLIVCPKVPENLGSAVSLASRAISSSPELSDNVRAI